jgi:hypothetical protein
MTPAPERPATEAGKHLLRLVEAWDLGERPDHMAAALTDILAIEALAPVTDAGLREALDGFRLRFGAIMDRPAIAPYEALVADMLAALAAPVTDAGLREAGQEIDRLFSLAWPDGAWRMTPERIAALNRLEAALSRQEKETA